MKCAVVVLAAVASALCAASAATAYDVRSFGVVGDGHTKDTAALQRALDACAKTGGRVVVPPGNYRTGSIFLGDNTELHLQEGRRLLVAPISPTTMPKTPMSRTSQVRARDGAENT